MGLRSALETVEDKLWSDGDIHIKPLETEAELIYAAYECQLSDEQKRLVNPSWFSIGRAYLFREDNYPCMIYHDPMTPIGFINFSKWLGEGDAYSWSYFIDQRYQGKGYGKTAAALAVQILKTADATKPIKLATEAGNEKAKRLYLSLGFQLLPELDGDDIVFEL